MRIEDYIMGGVTKDHFSDLRVEVIEGNVEAVYGHCKAHGNCAHLEVDLQHLLVEIIKSPHLFPHPRRTLRALEDNQVDFERAFVKYAQDTGEDVVRQIWNMCDRVSSFPQDKDIAETAAVLAAESLRLKITQIKDYKLDINDLVKQNPSYSAGMLAAIFAAVSRSIIATQNALEKYVREEGGKLPLNRGAAALLMLTGDVSPDVSALWTRLMTNIESVTRHDVKHGDIQIARAVYAPSGP